MNMPAPRGKKRKSEMSNASRDDYTANNDATQRVATKMGDESGESPRKKRKVDITLAQKQALIDNLQLEITERARKLRAQYNLMSQNLRTRIEIRVNRIPLALRKAKMGELLAKRSVEEQQKTTAPSLNVFRPPPVPEKDRLVGRPPLQRGAGGNASAMPPMGTAKRMSEDISGGDKENEMTQIDNPKKKARAGPATAAIRPNPAQVLSPTSSNSRILPPRERAAIASSPGRSMIARPVSPTKPATGLLSNMVQKARSTRAAATARKTTTSSTTSSSNGSAAAPATRTRRGATAAAPPPRAGATSRTTRRVSAISESSDGSTGTVVRKRTTAAAAARETAVAAPATTTRRTVMSTIRKGVTGTATRKAPAAKAVPAAATTGTGRVLRKRN